MKRLVFITLALLSVLPSVRAQSRLEEWTRKYAAYQSAWPRTRVHLVFNQEKYSPGDTAWFNAYFLNEDLTGVKGKQILELNLRDARGTSSVQLLFNVFEGRGQNQFVIPDTLAAGIYLVTVHSNWMRNFSHGLIFRKELSVVRKNKVIRKEPPSLKVAVEGGHLIRDVANQIIILNGTPGEAVLLLNASEQEIARGIADPGGTVSLELKPASNESYFIRQEREVKKIPLMATDRDGFGLHVLPAVSGEALRVRCSAPVDSPLRGEEISLLVSARGKVCYTRQFVQGQQEEVTVELPSAKLPEGIAHISLLDAGGHMLASRDVYAAGAGRAAAILQVKDERVSLREKVQVEVRVTDESGKPMEGEFSLSATNGSVLADTKRNVLADEVYFLSGIGPEFSVNALAAIDRYLIAATEEVPWKEILADEMKKPAYPFSQVIQKSGKAYFADSGKPVQELTQLAIYLQGNQKRYHTFAGAGGRVGFAMFDFFGEDEFLYLASYEGKDLPNVKIQWEEISFPLPQAPASRETPDSDAYAAFSAKTRQIDRAYRSYASAEKVVKRKRFASALEAEADGVDVSINVQDYIIFSTMDEFVKEVVPSLWYRRHGSTGMLRVSLPDPMTATGDPLFIIDGIATKNAAFFLSLRPADVLSLKIMYSPSRLERFGALGKDGIVIVQTLKGDAREPLDDDSKRIRGIHPTLEFPSRVYSITSDPHRPDFRSTLYWNPRIKTDAQGRAVVEFYTSDDVGKIILRVDGLTKDGKPFSVSGEVESTIRSEIRK